jgi:hypothetical protein
MCLYTLGSSLWLHLLGTLALGSLLVDIHARQLLNEASGRYLHEVAVFSGVLLCPLLPESWRSLGMAALGSLLFGAMVRTMRKRLRQMIALHPKIGFPLLWVSDARGAMEAPVSNKKALY